MLPDGRRPEVRQVPLLAVLFGLSTVSGAVVVAAASVIGLRLSGSPALATIPVALALVGGTAATLPAAHLMARRGRRTGFVAFTALSVAGALLAAWAIYAGSFALFVAGSFLLGTLGGVSPYYRFAAVEAAPDRPARAIGATLGGGVAAGLLGPPLGAAASGWVAGAEHAGSYLAMAALGVVVLILLTLLRTGAPAPRPAAGRRGRPLSAIARDPRVAAAAVAGVTAFGAMVLTMVAAPLSLHGHGAGEGDTALVIQAHVVAMFAPSFVSGPVAARLGHGRAMALGLVALACCVAVNLAGATVAHHWVALVLLGVGWNLLFVAGSALLATAHAPEEKARVQGANDLAVAATGAAAALAAGPLQGAVGWQGLNLAVGAALLLSAAALALLLRRGSQRFMNSGPSPAP